MTLSEFVKCFRSRRYDDSFATTDLYRALNLDNASGIRPSPLSYILPLDDDFLKRIERDVSHSVGIARRIGVEWLPRGAAAIRVEERRGWASRDQLKPLDDECTKWCTETYFPDAFSRVNLVANVVRLFDRLRALTDLRFRIVFKGGVMIRLVLKEFLYDLHVEARQRALAHMNKAGVMSMSDFDFEIVPSNHDPRAAFVHRFFTMDYAILLWLQRELQKQVEGRRPVGLLHLGWDEAERAEVLRLKLQTVVDAIRDPSNPLYKAKVDRVCLTESPRNPPRGYRSKTGDAVPPPRRNVIVFDCDHEKCSVSAKDAFASFGVRGVPVSSGGERFYATLNTYIGDAERVRPEHRRGLFHLARIKHAFVVYYTTANGERRCDRLSGEMVDLSQSHGVRMDELRNELYAHVPDPYRDYPILGVASDVVTIRSYSTAGFLFDLMSTIHMSDVPCWQVKKLGKRMARYVAFLFLHVLGPTTTGSYSSKLAALKQLTGRLVSQKSLSTPLRTSVPAVNAFASTERKSLLNAPPKVAAAYLRDLHTHMATMLDIMETPADPSATPRILVAQVKLQRAHLRITSETPMSVRACGKL